MIAYQLAYIAGVEPARRAGSPELKPLARTEGNALRHGGYAASDVYRETMLALSEDPQEFEDLYQGFLGAYEPADLQK